MYQNKTLSPTKGDLVEVVRPMPSVVLMLIELFILLVIILIDTMIFKVVANMNVFEVK